MNLKDWAAKQNLKEEKSSRKEISDLLALADQKIKDCVVLSGVEVSTDLYHACVYEAAIPCAKAVLRAEGFQVPKEAEGGHSKLFQSLTLTLDAKQKYLNALQESRKKRNQTLYVAIVGEDKSVIDNLLVLVRELRADAETWIHKHHSDLL
jgi:hypothetical protein